MAIASSSSISSSQKKRMSNKAIETGAMSMEDQGNASGNLSGKQNNSPGLNPSGGRIHDLQHGKTCHQCRQKRWDLVASCKNVKKDKPCPIKFCRKCLLNRYGENADEVDLLEVWSCPKCRGICNCSCCMKRRGHQPTGILVHTAKATGFSSVSEFLNCRGHENLGVTLSRKRGKENSFDRNTNQELQSGKKSKTLDDDETGKPGNNLSIGAPLRKSTCEKGEIFEQASKETDEHDENDANVIISPKKFDRVNMLDGNIEPKAQKEKRSKKIKQEDAGKDNSSHLKIPEEAEILNQVHSSQLYSNKIKQKKNGKADGKTLYGEDTECMQIDNSDLSCEQIDEVDECNQNMMNEDINDDIPLPEYSDLTTILGIELSPGDVGPAFQFLEFCSAFGEVLDLKKGQAESILRELVCSRDLMYGRVARGTQYSSAVQFHIRMLDMILGDSGDEPLSSDPTNGKNSWFESLGKCISKSCSLLDDVPSDYFTRSVDGYNALDSSKKLRLLNFLCDEALGTVELRKWIDDQNLKFLETQRETKEKVAVALKKKNHLKQKLNNQILEAVIANNGNALTHSEREAFAASGKRESEQALTELMAAREMLPKTTERADAVRTEPVFRDVDGQIFWKLKCISGGSDLLLQELKRVDAVSPDERWATYNPEDRNAVTEYIASRKKRKARSVKVAAIRN